MLVINGGHSLIARHEALINYYHPYWFSMDAIYPGHVTRVDLDIERSSRLNLNVLLKDNPGGTSF